MHSSDITNSNFLFSILICKCPPTSAVRDSCLTPVIFLSFFPPHFCPPLLHHFFILNKERNGVIFLLLPKPPLESIGHFKVKGKGLKRKVFHASCEWYAVCRVPTVTCYALPPLGNALIPCKTRTR